MTRQADEYHTEARDICRRGSRCNPEECLAKRIGAEPDKLTYMAKSVQ